MSLAMFLVAFEVHFLSVIVIRLWDLIMLLVICGIAGYVGYSMHNLYREDLDELLDDSVFWGRLLPRNVLYFIIGNVCCILPWEVIEPWIGGWFLHNEKAYIFLTAMFHWPLLQQMILYVNFSLFRKLYGRDPYDTAWSMDIKLIWPDGIFNFVNGAVSFAIPVLITALIRLAGS